MFTKEIPLKNGVGFLILYYGFFGFVAAHALHDPIVAFTLLLTDGATGVAGGIVAVRTLGGRAASLNSITLPENASKNFVIYVKIKKLLLSNNKAITNLDNLK